MDRRVQLHLTGPVARLTLHRPERLNALCAAMVAEIGHALDEVERSRARCLVIGGAGGAFCAGADLRALDDEIDLDDPRAVHEYVVSWGRVVERIVHFAVPTVAAVHGAAYGGGFSLAVACDIVVATPNARFNTQYLNIGINPDLASSWILPRRIGDAAARALFLRANEISGRRAYDLGLVAELAEDGDVDALARAVAEELAARPPDAVAHTRHLLERAAQVDLPTAIDDEARGIAARFATTEFRAVLADFRARARR